MNKCKANLEKFDGKCWLPPEKAPECGRVELVCTRWELVSFNRGDSEEGRIAADGKQAQPLRQASRQASEQASRPRQDQASRQAASRLKQSGTGPGDRCH